MVKKHPIVFVLLSVLVASLPAWTEVVWRLLQGGSSASPLGASSAPTAAFSPYWIAVPAGLALLAFVLRELRKGDRSPAAADSPASSDKTEEGGLGRETVAAQPPDAAAWRSLETDFLRVSDPGSRMRAEWREETGRPEIWTIEEALDHRSTRRFNRLAETAGSMLAESPADAPKFSAGTLKNSDPIHRWLSAIRERGINCQRMMAGQLVGERDMVVGHSTTGSISKLLRASAQLCQQLANEEESGGS